MCSKRGGVQNSWFAPLLTTDEMLVREQYLRLFSCRTPVGVGPPKAVPPTYSSSGNGLLGGSSTAAHHQQHHHSQVITQLQSQQHLLQTACHHQQQLPPLLGTPGTTGGSLNVRHAQLSHDQVRMVRTRLKDVAWSADGQRLFVASKEQVAVVNPYSLTCEGVIHSSATRLLAHPWNPQLLALLAYASPVLRLYDLRMPHGSPGGGSSATGATAATGGIGGGTIGSGSTGGGANIATAGGSNSGGSMIGGGSADRPCLEVCSEFREPWTAGCWSQDGGTIAACDRQDRLHTLLLAGPFKQLPHVTSGASSLSAFSATKVWQKLTGEVSSMCYDAFGELLFICRWDGQIDICTARNSHSSNSVQQQQSAHLLLSRSRSGGGDSGSGYNGVCGDVGGPSSSHSSSPLNSSFQSLGSNKSLLHTSNSEMNSQMHTQSSSNTAISTASTIPTVSTSSFPNSNTVTVAISTSSSSNTTTASVAAANSKTASRRNVSGSSPAVHNTKWFSVRAHSNVILSCAADPTGRLLATGGGDQIVSLFDIDSMSCVGTFSRLLGSVNTVSFAPGGALLAWGTRDARHHYPSGGGQITTSPAAAAVINSNDDPGVSSSISSDHHITVALATPCEILFQHKTSGSVITCTWHPTRYILAYACDISDVSGSSSSPSPSLLSSGGQSSVISGGGILQSSSAAGTPSARHASLLVSKLHPVNIMTFE